MTSPTFALLPARGLLAVSGADAVPFLQGLISNDVTKLVPGAALYGALLTAQGKFLHDFFVVSQADGLLLDVDGARLDDLAKRLKLYKLRAKVAIEPRSDLAVAAIWGAGAQFPAAFADPRLAAAGLRAILPAASARATLLAAGLTESTEADYDSHRLSLGLPDGARDLEIEKSTLLEAGFEELHGVDFAKGCYMGQELTARTKYRGLVKKRLLPVMIEGAAAPGTHITLDGKEAGEMRSSRNGAGIALIRLDAFDEARLKGVPLMAGSVALAAWQPDWMTLPEKSA